MKKKVVLISIIALTLILTFNIVNKKEAVVEKEIIAIANNYGEEEQITINDENLYKCLLDSYNSFPKNQKKDEDTTNRKFTKSELGAIRTISCSTVKDTKEDLKELETLSQYFSSVTLDLSGLGLSTYDDSTFTSMRTKIRSLILNNNNLTSIDLSGYTNLQTLEIEKNKLTSLDLSKNTKLWTLNVKNNSFKVSTPVILYKNIETDIKDKISKFAEDVIKIGTEGKSITFSKVSSFINSNNLDLNSENENVKITGKTAGKYSFKGQYYHKFYSTAPKTPNLEVGFDLYVTELTGVKSNYKIKNDVTEDKSYIYIGSDTVEEAISNLKPSCGTSECPKELTVVKTEDNKIALKNGEEIIKTFNVISYTSNYGKTDGYIYTQDKEYDNSLNVTNGTSTLSDDGTKITISTNDNETLETINVITYTTTYEKTGEDYIYIGSNSTFDRTKFTLNNKSAALKVENDKVTINYGTKVVDTFKIVKYTTTVDTAKDGYIFLGTSEYDENTIKVTNGTATLNGDKVEIKYNDEVLHSIDLIKYTTDYVAGNDYIYTKNEDFNKEKFKVSNVSEENITVNDILVKITYKDKTVSLFIVNHKSTEYPDLDLSKDYYDLGNKEFDLSKITTKNSTLSFDNGVLKLTRMGEEIGKTTILSYTSSTYDLSKDYIYLGTDKFNSSNINVTGYTVSNTDTELTLTYNEKIKTFKLLGITLPEGAVLHQNNITLNKEFTYDEFNVTLTDGLTYKIKKGTEEVTSGNIENGMTIEITYDNNVIATYTLSNDHLEFDNSIEVEENTNFLKDIKAKTKVSDLEAKIDTNGVIKVLNQKGTEVSTNDILGTGYKVVVTFATYSEEYTIIVTGDVTGDGGVTMSDIMKIASYTINKNNMTEAYYIKSADVTNDKNITMSDVMKISDYVIKGKEGEL